VLKSLLDTLNVTVEFGSGAVHRLVWNPPHRFQWGWVLCQPWDDVPVNVGELIAEQFVVDLLGPIGMCERLGDPVHFLHELDPFCRRQMEEFRCVALKDNHRPPGEELVIMEIGFRESKIRDEMIGSGPGPLAGLAGWIGHGRLALRHSSSVSTPFFIKSWMSLSKGVGLG
jgi:hypothetical protein